MWTTIAVLMSGVWKLLKPVLIMIAKEIKEESIELALEIVEELSNTDLSSEQKRLQAFNTIKIELQDSGEELADASINLLVELAVSKIKRELDN
jgi:hypothetical protein